MPKLINDDELIRLTLESEETSQRLYQLRQRKDQHESAMTKLDERHWEMVQRIRDLTEHLNHITDELRKVNTERTGRTNDLRHLVGDIKETAKRGRALRRAIQDGIGRDVCPKCGSTEIATIRYGYPVEEPDVDLFEPDYVMGGSCVNPDETVRCLDCGKDFLGNFDKWQRAQMETVFEVGAEGGTLAIVRQRNQSGNWEYWCLGDEMTMSDLLPENEIGNREVLLEESAHVDKFEDALLRLDKYPWHRLVPLKVSAEFADLVLWRVEKRGGDEAAVEWTETLRRHHSVD